MVRLIFLMIFMNVLPNNVLGKIHSYAFEELLLNKCNNSCDLHPKTGTPFRIEYVIERREIAGGGTDDFADIKLNGKRFKQLKSGSAERGYLPFYQEYFFDDHKFQIYSLSSSIHATTSYNYYFRRLGDTFYLLGEDAFPALSYDYDNTDRKQNERFYALEGHGRGQYMRTNYKLEDNLLIQTGVEQWKNGMFESQRNIDFVIIWNCRIYYL